MTEITLLTQRLDVRASTVTITNDGLRIPPSNLSQFCARAIKGLQLPGQETQLAPDAHKRKVRNNLKEEAIHLSDEKAHRLGEYVSRIIVDEEPLFRNCVSFVSFIHAGSPALEDVRPPIQCHSEVDKLVPTPADGLLEGESYIVSTPYKQNPDEQYLVHGVIGANNCEESLGVWGDNGTLAISNNYNMLEFYQGTHIYRIDGNFTITSVNENISE